MPNVQHELYHCITLEGFKKIKTEKNEKKKKAEEYFFHQRRKRMAKKTEMAFQF